MRSLEQPTPSGQALVAHIPDEKRMSTHYCWDLWRLRVCGWSLCLAVSPDATLPAGWGVPTASQDSSQSVTTLGIFLTPGAAGRPSLCSIRPLSS